MSGTKEIAFDKKKYFRFKREYSKHEKCPENYFMFEGDEFNVGYAHYLIEYLKPKFEKNGK